MSQALDQLAFMRLTDEFIRLFHTRFTTVQQIAQSTFLDGIKLGA
jgi:hypothetical protein